MNQRALMAAWNMLYLKSGVFQPDRAQSAEWNRGAYLVEGLGHCSSCHTPRNALGAEVKSRAYDGGVAEGWEAPPLNGLSYAPVPWSEGELYTYLRTGFSPLHGPAAGPMGPVIHGLQAMPDADLRAMAHYLASLSASVSAEPEQAAIAAAEARNAGAMLPSAGPGGRIFQGACAVCHVPSAPALFGVKPNLAFNTNLHSNLPDNLIRIILGGVPDPALASMGPMPAFGRVLSDGQIVELVRFLRRQYAPGQPEWTGLEKTIAKLRAAQTHAGP
jgi:nicotinate dehydrogenase subunit B